jgi:hypothetical protein
MSNDQEKIKALIEKKIKEGKTKHEAHSEAVEEVRGKKGKNVDV